MHVTHLALCLTILASNTSLHLESISRTFLQALSAVVSLHSPASVSPMDKLAPQLEHDHITAII